MGIGVDNGFGQRITTLDSRFDSRTVPPEVVEGDFEFVCEISELGLIPGEYTVKLALQGNGMLLESLENALSFSVVNSDYFRNGRQPGKGVVVVPQRWSIAG